MFIPKSKMNTILDAIAVALANENWETEEMELLAQIADRASLCQHGDANFLEIEVFYGNTPPK